MGNILRFPGVQPDLPAVDKTPSADIPPMLEEVEGILRRAADEIARRGIRSFNIAEQDKLRLHAWIVHNCITFGRKPFCYDGSPWRSIFTDHDGPTPDPKPAA